MYPGAGALSINIRRTARSTFPMYEGQRDTSGGQSYPRIYPSAFKSLDGSIKCCRLIEDSQQLSDVTIRPSTVQGTTVLPNYTMQISKSSTSELLTFVNFRLIKLKSRECPKFVQARLRGTVL